MVAGSAAGARITGTNGSQDICHPETAWITGGGREEMSTGGAEPTLHSLEVFGTIQSHGGASALTCHSWGWALTRWTGIIPAASYNSEEGWMETKEAVSAVDTEKKHTRKHTHTHTHLSAPQRLRLTKIATIMFRHMQKVSQSYSISLFHHTFHYNG